MFALNYHCFIPFGHRVVGDPNKNQLRHINASLLPCGKRFLLSWAKSFSFTFELGRQNGWTTIEEKSFKWMRRTGKHFPLKLERNREVFCFLSFNCFNEFSLKAFEDFNFPSKAVPTPRLKLLLHRPILIDEQHHITIMELNSFTTLFMSLFFSFFRDAGIR